MAKTRIPQRVRSTPKGGKKKATKKKAASKKVEPPAGSEVTAGAPRPPHPYLEEVLVALQKSFSRVNNLSAGVPEDQARALMVGDVHFQISLKVEPAAGTTSDFGRLLVKPDGEIDLSLTGAIDTDIRLQEEGKEKE